MELYRHQKLFLEKNPETSLLCWDTGTGKTRAAIEYSYKNPGNVIIVCPKAVLRKWVSEVCKWTETSPDIVKQLSDRSYRVHTDNGFFTVMTKEYFRKYGDGYKYHETVVIDEAHYFAGMTSLMSKNLGKFIREGKIERVLLLTATPYMSSPWNIYTLAQHLGYRWSYPKFRDAFFEERYIGSKMVAGRKVGKKIWVPQKNIENRIAKLVDRIGDIVDIQNAADIPEQTFDVLTTKLTKQQRAAMLDIDEVNPVVRYTKFHQIENGTLKGNDYEDDKLIHNEKIEAINTYAEGARKIAVICRYNLQVEQVAKALKKIKKNVFIINGATKDKEEIVEKVELLDDCAVVINASCSEGYELPSINTIIFASLSYSYKDYKQMLGRFLRLNRLSKNYFLHLITVSEVNDIFPMSVDEAVYKSIKKKEDFNIEIYAQSVA